MINRISTRIELKLEEDIYEYEEMINLKMSEQQPLFSPLQCEIEINLNNNFNDLPRSDLKIGNINELNTNNMQGNLNISNVSKFNVNKI